MITSRIILTVSFLLLIQSQIIAIEIKDRCPDFNEVDPLEECITVESYSDFADIIRNAQSGSQISLCPFFIRKTPSIATAEVNSGVRVRCARKTVDEFCTIDGLGNHLVIDSAEDTLWQGFVFRGSNDHAVFVAGNTENSDKATHTFCQTSFVENVRTKDTRGGALMLSRSSGTINIVESFFTENYSKTFGASIYSRANQLNVVYSLFFKNRSIGYGPAIYSASGADLMIKDSSFRSNKGREGYNVVFHPSTGTENYQDGFENSVSDGDCRGVFNSVEAECIVFEKSPSTPTPTVRRAVTSKPTNKPTVLLRTTSAPSIAIQPITVRTRFPVIEPSRSPTKYTTSEKDTTSSPIRQSSSIRPVTANIRKPATRPTITVPIDEPKLPNNEPTILIPTSQAPERVIGIINPEICVFNKTADERRKCIEVQSFEEFKSVIEADENDVLFCGGFRIAKTETSESAKITTNVDIRCLVECSFAGIGPFVEIGGALTNIRFMNIKFENSQDYSAVVVSTLSSVAQTNFCDMTFTRNQVSIGKKHSGGAITIDSKSGVVNVINSTFTGNVASRGGAIQSSGSMLNIFDSKFVANNAYHAGTAIFVEQGNLLIRNSSFLLNTNVPTRTETRQGRLSKDNYVIAVDSGKSIRANSRDQSTRDAGLNSAILSGKCGGIYQIDKQACDEFITTH